MTTKPKAAVSGDINAAVLSERLRVSAILESAEGKRNPALAQELALRSSLDVDTARGILGKAPPSNPFIEAMNRHGSISLGGDGLGATVETFVNDPKAARLKEIEQSVGHFNESRGLGKSRARKNG
jgi:hypothetical protein